MNYIGIDPSLTGSGIAILDDNCINIFSDVIETFPIIDLYLCIEQRLDDIFLKIKKILDLYEGIVYIENFGYASKDTKLFERVGLIFLIRHYMFINDIKFKIIAPKSLKKFITNNGNADKELMMKTCEEQWGQKFTDHNICDAFCLAKMAYEENK